MNSFVALTNANAQQSGAMPIWGLIGIYAVFFALIWLIFLRPQSKKRKTRRTLLFLWGKQSRPQRYQSVTERMGRSKEKRADVPLFHSNSLSDRLTPGSIFFRT